jgi:hypothetical protein
MLARKRGQSRLQIKAKFARYVSFQAEKPAK